MTIQVRIDPDAPSNSMLHRNRYWSILLNIPINYHPMNLFPALAPTSNSNIADLFTRPLPIISHHRFDTLIGDDLTSSFATPVASTVDSVTVAPTVVASAPIPTTPASDSVPFNPNLDPAPLPVVLDTGAPYSVTSFASDFALRVTQAPYGLIRSPTSVVSDSKAYSALASTPVDPYTLITGEDAVAFDLSSPDTTIVSDLVEPGTLEFREFGTATLTLIYTSNLELFQILVEPTQIDWLQWVPLPRLTPTESYFHIFGFDYLQAFALFHLIPIWIYYLLHFAVDLED